MLHVLPFSAACSTATPAARTLAARSATLAARSALALAALAAFGCSTNKDGQNSNGTPIQGAPVCLSANTKLDCNAKANVHDASVLVGNGQAYVAQLTAGAPGTITPFKFFITNVTSDTAAAPLYIDKVELLYTPPPGPDENVATGDVAFTCLDGTGKESCKTHAFKPVVPATFASDSMLTSETILINFKQFDTADRHAKLVITFRNDLDLAKSSGGKFTINLSTKLGQAKIKVDPESVSWGYVAPKSTDSKQFSICNTGLGDLVCKQITFTDPQNVFSIDALGGLQHIVPSAGLIDLKEPVVVPAGLCTSVTVTAAPTDDKLKQGAILLKCNDPAQVNGTNVPLSVNAEVPCLKLNPTSLKFGGALVGDVATKDVEVTSCGGAQLCLTGFDFADGTAAPGEYELDFSKMKKDYCPDMDVATGPTKAKPCCIPTNKKTWFTVKYSPGDVSPLSDPNNPASDPVPDTVNVQVSSSAFPGAGGNSVAVSGAGVKQTCPLVKVEIAEGEEVVPQTLLHLKGDNSKGMGGASIKSYKWTVKQPPGSNKGFLPSSIIANPTFQPDAAGEYTFCLEVVDANGVQSCAPECKTVLVVPDKAVHVELLWDTPQDPDQTDTGPAAGADMDLHFGSYLAQGPDLDCDGVGDPWFSNPFDCFWFSPDPQWGSSNTAIQDDPTLDLDDTDGAGPENLSLESPEGTIDLPRYYSIGVHYWNDHGYGVSFATTTVYLLGAVALKIDKVSMNPLDMWYVAKLNWPNTLVGGQMPPLTVCYQSGDTCSGQGKMWQPKGDWCMTPCYVNPTFSAGVGGAQPANCKKP